MMRSMFSSVSGLRNFQTRMDVIGDNIANVNTPGFKASDVYFLDTFAQTLRAGSGPSGDRGGINPLQIGLGTAVARILPNFGEAPLEMTGRATDLAVEGEGFFVLKAGGGNLYSRAGLFSVDSAGYLVDPNGYRVQGWMADAAGTVDTARGVEDVRVQGAEGVAARATSLARLAGVLAEEQAGSVGLTVFGPDGASYALTMTFTPTAAAGDHTWNYSVTGPAGVTLSGATSGTLTFDNVTHKLSPTVSPSITVTPSAGQAFTFALDLSAVEEWALAGAGTITPTLSGSPTTNVQLSACTLAGTAGDITVDASTGSFTVDLGGSTVNATLEFLRQDATTYTVRWNVTGGSATPNQATLRFDPVTGAFASLTPPSFTVSDGTNSTTVTLDASKLRVTGLNVAGQDGHPAQRTGGVIPARATRRLEFEANLDAAAPAGTTVVRTATAFDSLGNRHTLVVTFTKSAVANRWDYALTSPEGLTVSGGTGQLVFTSDGMLDAGMSSVPAVSIAVPGADPLALTLRFDGVTQVAGDSTVAVSQTTPPEDRGYPAGVFEGFRIEADGSIVGFYSNDVRRTLGRIALARFPNPEGLERQGGGLFAASGSSGLPTLGAAASGALGAIRSGALEMSNVDLAREFTNMIITQRAFQANSRVITASDEMLQELANLKR
ncbi:MAG: flagellar hook-basal body complex protein [Clostridia bacterium]|nr:flagellar hook-basal body complex protein [Clostridia bacterium]